MAMKQLSCRTHGGQFSVERKAGRPPTRCSEDNICDQHPIFNAVAQGPDRIRRKSAQNRRTRRAKVEPTPEPPKPKPTLRGINRAVLRTGKWCRCPKLDGERHEKGIEGCKYATRKAPVVIKHNPSVPLAQQAKNLLEPEGWQCKGRGWFNEDNQAVATLVSSRGKEIVSLMWVAGKLTSQTYSMFTGDSPSLEGMPKPKLDFSPGDMSDLALVKRLAGSTITWWNRIGRNKETATLPHHSDSKVKIEHLMNGSGTEEKRVLSFVDQQGTGHRAFDIAALLSVK